MRDFFSFSRFILNKPQQCSNGHQYCLTCIREWTQRGNKTCPLCGAEAKFNENYLLRSKIDSKYVRCESSYCKWKGRLERLIHHVKENHSSSTESVASTDRSTLSSDDRIELHKSTRDVDRLHHWKKEVLQKRIRKMEKKKRREHLKRESVQTMVPDSNTVVSRSENYRPFTDVTERKTPLKLPHVEWRQPAVNIDSFYQRLQDIENVKQVKRYIKLHVTSIIIKFCLSYI